MAALDYLDEALAGLNREGLERSLRRLDSPQAAEIELDGRSVINFAANNYLGLADHPALAEAAGAAAARWGSGAGASRLIIGNLAEHESLEREVAAFHRAPAALLFNSGYQANVGIVSSLAGPDDLIVSDELNHASLIDGCRLSRARVAVFRHRDVSHARELLAQAARRKLLISETIFSMDGDRAAVADLADIAREHNAALVLDEAHAVGAIGPQGRGLAAEAGVVPDVLVGTFGKSFGSFGAYVAGSAPLRRWLLSRARSFVFTTALPAAVVAASRAGLALACGPEGDRRRESLALRIRQVAYGLERHLSGIPTSPIVPIVIGDDRRVMSMTGALLEHGLYVQGIRPPTVPRGTSRLRIGLSSEHSPEHISRLTEAIGDVLRN